jgi:hypothetical protein
MTSVFTNSVGEHLLYALTQSARSDHFERAIDWYCPLCGGIAMMSNELPRQIERSLSASNAGLTTLPFSSEPRTSKTYPSFNV